MGGAKIDLGIPHIGPAELIGAGGSAAVFAADQTETGQRVAVKVLRLSAATERDRTRFENEQKSLTLLAGHDGIVPILGSGVTDRGEPYLLMSLMSASAQDYVDRAGSLPWQHASAIISEIGEAVSFAHEAGIIHRDIKPGNILTDESGRVHVADFGIAKLCDSGGSTSTNLAGTPSYMAPEQLRGSAASVASDVYSLAATFVALTTGIPPFQGGPDENRSAVMLRVLTDPPPSLTDIPERVSELIQCAMSKDPNNRPQSVQAFIDEMRDATLSSSTSEPVNVTLIVDQSELDTVVATADDEMPSPEHPPLDSPPRKSRVLAAMIAIAVGISAGSVAAYVLNDDPEPAQVETATAHDVPDTSEPSLPDTTAPSATEASEVAVTVAGRVAVPDTPTTEADDQDETPDDKEEKEEEDNNEDDDDQEEAAPTASINATTTVGLVGDPIRFTSASAGTITSTRWMLGDGSSTDETEVTHRYKKPGTFEVTLLVSGPGGNDSATTTVTISEEPIETPNACFNAPTTAAVGTPVTFKNCSTQATSFSWDFDDEHTSTSRNPTHTFTTAGTYTVSLIAKQSGATNQTSKTITLEAAGERPTACVRAAAAQVRVGEAVIWTNCSTGGSTYEWDFGDNTTSTAQRPSNKSYSTAGTYDISLTVRNEYGSETGSFQLIVVNSDANTTAPEPPGKLRCTYVTDTVVQWTWPIYAAPDSYFVTLADGSQVDTGKTGTYETTDGNLRSVSAKLGTQSSSTDTNGKCSDAGGTPPEATAPPPAASITCEFIAWFPNDANTNWASWSERWTWRIDPAVTSVTMEVEVDGVPRPTVLARATTWDALHNKGAKNSGVSLQAITTSSPGGSRTVDVQQCTNHGGVWKRFGE